MKKATPIIVILVIIVISAIAYFVFFKKKRPGEDPVAAKVRAIQSDPEWMSHIGEKAQKAGIPVEKQILLDAQYCVNTGKC